MCIRLKGKEPLSGEVELRRGLSMQPDQSYGLVLGRSRDVPSPANRERLMSESNFDVKGLKAMGLLPKVRVECMAAVEWLQ